MSHGTENGYVNHGCRCDLCKKAMLEARMRRRDRSGSWGSRMIEHLCDLKRAGYGFDEAWRLAIKHTPPPRRDRGIETETLFEAASPEAETIAEFTYRVCSDAWHGRRPALQHLQVLTEDGAVFPEAPGTQALGRNRIAA